MDCQTLGNSTRAYRRSDTHQPAIRRRRATHRHPIGTNCRHVARPHARNQQAWFATTPRQNKIMHNAMRARGGSKQHSINIADMNIEILSRSSATKYLGRMLSFDQSQQTELDNRTAAAWRKFWVLKQELTSKHYRLNDRIRLFEGAVTPTLLYGSATWTLTKGMENQIRRTQRRMLRMILGAPRRQQCTTQTYQPQTTTTNKDDPTTT